MAMTPVRWDEIVDWRLNLNLQAAAMVFNPQIHEAKHWVPLEDQVVCVSKPIHACAVHLRRDSESNRRRLELLLPPIEYLSGVRGQTHLVWRQSKCMNQDVTPLNETRGDIHAWTTRLETSRRQDETRRDKILTSPRCQAAPQAALNIPPHSRSSLQSKRDKPSLLTSRWDPDETRNQRLDDDDNDSDDTRQDKIVISPLDCPVQTKRRHGTNTATTSFLKVLPTSATPLFRTVGTSNDWPEVVPVGPNATCPSNSPPPNVDRVRLELNSSTLVITTSTRPSASARPFASTQFLVHSFTVDTKLRTFPATLSLFGVLHGSGQTSERAGVEVLR
ncbi:hypothetical protein C8R46DRAFT_1280315 [Mycena filopes]|nr:hypothetical protein C8R46DRAFT_1280315 [Mycena filopes]